MASGYFAFLLHVTIFMRNIGERRELSLIPFHILLNWEKEKVFIFENILFFVPFGVLVYIFICIKRRPSLARVLIYAALVSVIIEVIQYIFALGKTETDDVICNVIGAFIGCVLCKVLRMNKRTKSVGI